MSKHLPRTSAYTVTAAAVLSLTLAACNADAPTAAPMLHPADAWLARVADYHSPSSTPAPTGPTVVSTVRLARPLARDVIVSAQIDAKGGRLKLDATGFELIVPKGAVSKLTTFRVKAVAGSAVAYEFEPHGATFATPLRFSQSLRYIDLRSVGSAMPEIGYFSNQAQIDQVAGTAVVTELTPAIAITDVSGSKAEGNIYHFSGYLVSSGRTTTVRKR